MKALIFTGHGRIIKQGSGVGICVFHDLINQDCASILILTPFIHNTKA